MQPQLYHQFHSLQWKSHNFSFQTNILTQDTWLFFFCWKVRYMTFTFNQWRKVKNEYFLPFKKKRIFSIRNPFWPWWKTIKRKFWQSLHVYHTWMKKHGTCQSSYVLGLQGPTYALIIRNYQSSLVDHVGVKKKIFDFKKWETSLLHFHSPHFENKVDLASPKPTCFAGTGTLQIVYPF